MEALRPSGRTIYFFGALGGLLFGYDTGVISGALLFIPDDFKLTPFLQGAIVAALLLGAMVGAGFAGRLADRLGRRKLIMSAAIIFTVGALLAAFAPSVGILIAARFIIGLAVGSAALVVPLYLSEIAPTEVRGAVASLNQLMIVGGILAAFIVNAILASSGNWRLMLGLAAVPSLILLVGMIFMPETPRHLVHTGDEDTARDVLEDLPGDERPQERIEEIREVEQHEDGDTGLRGLLKATWVRPALIVASGLAIFQQFVGINTIIYYAPTTLTNVGFGKTSAIYANLVIGVVNVGMTIIAIRLIDRAGRKPLLIAGVIGMVTSLLVLGVSLSVLPTPHHPGDPAAIITLVCLGTFIASFAATWGPVVWVMIPEVLPLSVRGTAMGVAVLANWAANFLVSQTFPILLNKFGPGPVFLGYAGMGVLAFVFVKQLVTETKGRSLEEIETDLQRATGTRESREQREPVGSR
ncbi:MAG TPA: sugar porter family MFS transporter [Thermoleophilaceae bacterium]|jgi:sugar porter (SP) family MFS transporter|nr:sugar porter family MFS transporter [Thermoleophilaceae bacterium]